MISLSLDLVAVECGTDRPHDGFLRLHVLPASQCGLGLLASTQIASVSIAFQAALGGLLSQDPLGAGTEGGHVSAPFH